MIESLESRRMMSATVTEMYPGFYDVEGSDSADWIHATVSQADGTMTLEDTTYTNVAYVYIHGNGGSDNISLLSVDGPGSIGGSITGDDGNDRITLNFDGGVWGGAGNDVVRLSDSFRGEAHGDDGNDRFYISGACIGAAITGDDGDDLIDCSSNQYSVTVRAGAGDDTVYGSAFDDEIYGDGGTDSLVGGDGNDSFFSTGGTVDGGDGHDVVYASGVIPDTFSVEESFLG